jgi:phosphate/sulfate permease
LGNSLLGSLLNTVAGLALLLLYFAGMWLHERFAVPVWILVVLGIAAAIGAHTVQRRVFLSLALRNPRRQRSG